MPDLQRTSHDIKAGFDTVGSEVQLVTLNKSFDVSSLFTYKAK